MRWRCSNIGGGRSKVLAAFDLLAAVALLEEEEEEGEVALLGDFQGTFQVGAPHGLEGGGLVGLQEAYLHAQSP